MRQFFLVIVLFSAATCFGQNKQGVTKVEIYFMYKNGRYSPPLRREEIEKRHEIFARLSGDDFEFMFDNYRDCKMKLSEYPALEMTSDLARIKVDFYFGLRKVEIYFLPNGWYFYDGKWHEMNPNMTYNLFHYFSSELVNRTVIDSLGNNLENHGIFW